MEQEEFMRWLLTPTNDRTVATQSELADLLGIDKVKLTRWKKYDEDFIAEWHRRYKAGIGSPEKKSKIMDTLFATATDPDDPKHVQAAKTFFEIEGSLKPQGNIEVNVGAKVGELSDEALEAALAKKATDELAKRREDRDAS